MTGCQRRREPGGECGSEQRRGIRRSERVYSRKFIEGANIRVDVEGRSAPKYILTCSPHHRVWHSLNLFSKQSVVHVKIPTVNGQVGVLLIM